MRKRAWMLLLAGVVSLGAQGQAANLSGTWKLSVAKCFLGGDHPYPDYAVTRTIEQKGDTVSLTDASVHNSVVGIPLPDAKATTSMTADGKEHEVQLQGQGGRPGPTVTMKAEWQGGTLELLQIVSGYANYSKHRFFVSEDGSRLTELVEQHTIYGDGEQRLVFEKAQ